jgi:YgiT-type zinc finger domain-containing protein
VNIEDIIDAIRNNRIRIMDHADEEAEADKLSFDEIYFSVLQGEIIEDYPDDTPYPSCLIYGDTFSGDTLYTAFGRTMRTISGQYSSPFIAPTQNDGSIGGKGNRKMMPFDKCPVCGGEMVEKDVEKLLRGGIHTAVLTVHAEVCLRCGERLYSQETVRRFEQIRAKLERQEVADFQPLGQSFQVA